MMMMMMMMMMITVALFCFLSVSLSDTRSFNNQTKEFIHAQLDWMHSSQSSDTHARDSAIPHDTGGDRREDDVDVETQTKRETRYGNVRIRNG